MQFEKITTRYDEFQDRLRIDGQTAGGEVVTLWVTYRLLRHLIPLLLQLITPAAGSEDKSKTLAEWALTMARARQKPEKAVVRQEAPTQMVQNSPAASVPPPPSWLVHAIELKSSPAKAVLLFRISERKEVVTLPFTPEHLRQWLGIVYGLWQRAGWPESTWPEWVKVAETPAAPAAAMLH